MNRRFYWLKLQHDFFKSKRIKKLRKLAGGDTYTIIYLKMQLLALERDGILEFTGIEPTFPKELALDIDEDEENVAITINYLLSCGLLVEKTDSEYELPYVIANTGSETASTLRSRKSRNMTKALQCNTNATHLQQLCNGEKEIEKERELEIEKDIENKKETFVSLLSAYTQNDELRQALNDFIDMRKRMKGFTIQAFKLALNKLDSLAIDDRTKTDIVNQSVMNSWKAFYPLKEKQLQGTGNAFLDMLERGDY